MRKNQSIAALWLLTAGWTVACGSTFDAKDPLSDAASGGSDAGAEADVSSPHGGASGHSGSGGQAGAAGVGGAGGALTGGSAGTATGGSAGSSAGSGGTAGAAGYAGCEAGFECQPGPPDPNVWSLFGWIELNAPEVCPTSAPSEVKLHSSEQVNNVPDPQCACGCTVPSGACRSTLTCGSGTNCTVSSGLNAVGTSCVSLSFPGATMSCRATAPVWSADSTCAVAPTEIIPPVNPDIRACTMAAASATQCGTGKFCAPTPPPPALGPCIVAKQHGLTCPAPYTHVKRVAFTGITDTRDCNASDCGCGAAQGSCACSGTSCGVASNLGTSCVNTGAVVLPADSSCHEMATIDGGSQTYAFRLVGITGTGSCEKGGVATPTGDVVGTGEWTICCMQ